jgi:hypothetical protein
MKEFLKNYQLIVALSLIVVVMASIKVIYGNKVEEINQNQVILPTSTIEPIIETPTLIPTIALTNEEKYPLWRILPYQGKGFTVQQYQKPLTLTVKIKSGNKEMIEGEIAKWLIQNEIDPQSHLIEWE